MQSNTYGKQQFELTQTFCLGDAEIEMCQEKISSKWIKLLIAIIVCFLLNSQAIAAIELIDKVGIFEDQANSHDLESAQQQLFAPSKKNISLGYSASTFWLRLRILPASDGGVVVLSLTSRMLDEVDLFVPVFEKSSLQTDKKKSEEHVIYKKSKEVSPNKFEIYPPKDGAYYFLRLASNGTISSRVLAQPLNQAMRAFFVNDAQNISYLLILVSILLWALYSFITSRKSLFGWFIPMQIAWILHNLLSIGYIGLLFPNADKSNLCTIFRCLVVTLSILVSLFHRSVLIRFDPARYLIRLLDLHIIFSAAIAFFYFTTGSNFALRLNAINIAVTPIIFVMIAASAKNDVPPGILSIKIIYSALFVLSMLWVLQLLGLEISNIPTINGPAAYGLFVSAIVFFIQIKYAKSISLEAEKASRDLDRLQQAENLTREANKTLFHFLSMLSHETKNALSVINMTIATSQISENHRGRITTSGFNLNRVIERCSQALHLEEINKRINLQVCSLSQVLERLCNGNVMKDRINLVVPKFLSLSADPVLLDIIFGNLIENAIKYSPPESPVNINVTTDGAVVVVIFENFEGTSGTPDPEQVFKRYYRHKNAHGQPGSGLGLYIVRELVNAHKGQIYYNRTEVGIQFRVTLPC